MGRRKFLHPFRALVLIVVVFDFATKGELSREIENGKIDVKVGKKISLNCPFEHKNGTKVRWLKRTDNNSDTTLAEQLIELSDDYTQQERVLVFDISNVNLTDGGQYVCEQVSPNNENRVSVLKKHFLQVNKLDRYDVCTDEEQCKYNMSCFLTANTRYCQCQYNFDLLSKDDNTACYSKEQINMEIKPFEPSFITGEPLNLTCLVDSSYDVILKWSERTGNKSDVVEEKIFFQKNSNKMSKFKIYLKKDALTEEDFEKKYECSAVYLSLREDGYQIRKDISLKHRCSMQGCKSDSDCSETNAECRNGKCLCKTTRKLKIKEEIRHLCFSKADCSSDLVCDGGACHCPNNSVRVIQDNKEKCLPKAVLQENCISQEQCPENTICKEKCVCMKGFVEKGSKCYPQYMGQPCDTDDQCPPFAECNPNGRCSCRFGQSGNLCSYSHSADQKSVEVYKAAMIAAACFMIIILAVFVGCVVKRSFFADEPVASRRRGASDIYNIPDEIAAMRAVDKPPPYDEIVKADQQFLGIPPPEYCEVTGIPCPPGICRTDHVCITASSSNNVIIVELPDPSSSPSGEQQSSGVNGSALEINLIQRPHSQGEESATDKGINNPAFAAEV